MNDLASRPTVSGKSASDGLRANETLGARLLTPRRSSLSSNLSINVRIMAIVTDSTQREKPAPHAPLTVLARRRMVAPGDEGEHMMERVTGDMLEEASAAIHRGCRP